jgi:hypothetical protein
MGDKTIYKKYVKAMGIPAVASCLSLAVLWGFFTNFPTVCKLTAPRVNLGLRTALEIEASEKDPFLVASFCTFY